MLAVGAFPPVAPGQEAPSNYRVSFRMVESGTSSKPVTLSYVIAMQSGSRGRINASRRIPFYTSVKGEAKELHTVAVGSIIDCTVDDREANVRLNCSFESGYVAPDQPAMAPPVGFPPHINNRQVSTTTLVGIGPEVRIASLDDPSSGNRLEVYVRVERFNGGIAR